MVMETMSSWFSSREFNSTVHLPAIRLVKLIIAALETRRVIYCHFKSNEHISASLLGDTDLDLLFVSEDQELINNVLVEAGLRKFEAIGSRKYPGIVDYIGVDELTGKVVHVHAHFQLIVGETGIKSYHLPWETTFLKARKLDNDSRLYIVCPEFEMILLIVRCSLKINYRQRWRFLLFRIDHAIIGDFAREFDWLKKRISLSSLLSAADLLLPGHKKSSLVRSYEKGLRLSDMLRLRSEIGIFLESNRRLSRFDKYLVILKRKIVGIKADLGVKTIPNKRVLDGEGILIVLLGPDGAGKSTQTKKVYEILSKKIDIHFQYMGSGIGNRSLFRNFLVNLVKLRSKMIGTPYGSRPNHKSDQTRKNDKVEHPAFLKLIYQTIFIFSVALEKRFRLQRIRRYKNKGVIVLCDRFPQIHVLGINDGPRFSTFFTRRNFITDALIRFELACYSYATYVPPDLVIKLIGSDEILSKRRPEMSLKEIVLKQKLIEKLEFPNSTKVVTISADLPMESVTISIMNEIRKLLNNNDDKG
jgi:hypothetical protein